jgi:peptide chain release factor 1
VKVEGLNVWNYLKFETGVHRVQRVPKTETRGRIHTSTIAVACIPLLVKDRIKINEKDLKMETKRASGAGGQHVNKTESAVRIIHLPTGIAVESQEDKSQIKNRETAMKKLNQILADQHAKEVFDKYMQTKKSQVGHSNRNEKIRTYNFQQDRITDHRLSQTSEDGTIFNLEDFLNNPERLENFINVIRRSDQEKNLIEILNRYKV